MSRASWAALAVTTIASSWVAIHAARLDRQQLQLQEQLARIASAQEATVGALNRLASLERAPSRAVAQLPPPVPAQPAQASLADEEDEEREAPDEPRSLKEQAIPSAASTYLDRALAAQRWTARDADELQRLLKGADADERAELMRRISMAINDDKLVTDVMPPF